MGRTATSSPGKPGQPSQRKTKQVKRIVAKSVSPDENHPHKERRNEPHPATIAKHGRKYLWGFAKQIVTLGNSDEHKNLRSDNESTILGRGTIVVVPPEVVRANQAAHGGNYEQALNSYTADEKPRRRAIFLGAVVMAGTTSLLFNAPLPLHTAVKDTVAPIPVVHTWPYFHKGSSNHTPSIPSLNDPSTSVPSSVDTTPSSLAPRAAAAIAPNLNASPTIFKFGIRAQTTEFDVTPAGKAPEKVTCLAIGGLARLAGEGLVDPDLNTVNAIHRAESAPGVVNTPNNLGADLDFQNGIYNGLFKKKLAPYDNPAHYANAAGAEFDIPIDCSAAPLVTA